MAKELYDNNIVSDKTVFDLISTVFFVFLKSDTRQKRKYFRRNFSY